VIILSQKTYWELLKASQNEQKQDFTSLENRWIYPTEIGLGYCQSFWLRAGLHLDIFYCRPHQILHIQMDERPHPLEFVFRLAGNCLNRTIAVQPGEYMLYGSGVAPKDTCQWACTQHCLVTIHVEPNLLEIVEDSPLQHLICPQGGSFVRGGQVSPMMQTTLYQILNAPYHGVAQRFYLEGKVLEIISQVLAEEQQICTGERSVPSLKPEDCDRIIAARDILINRLDDPPSLVDLARQVGLNECTLKRGFHQVFGTTAFGYLHEHRLEQAQQLLASGDFNVSEVIRRVGFASRSHFASAFRRRFGVNPGVYARSSRSL
jgi:AraC-like DNA-binding protein